MFKNISVKWKLGIGFTAVVGFFVITLLVVGIFLSSLSKGVRQINDASIPLVLAVVVFGTLGISPKTTISCLASALRRRYVQP